MKISEPGISSILEVFQYLKIVKFLPVEPMIHCVYFLTLVIIQYNDVKEIYAELTIKNIYLHSHA
jgi:hypothetical protein